MTAPIVVPRPWPQAEGVGLRAWRDDDVPAIVAMARDPDIIRFTSVPDPYTNDAARVWLALQPARQRAGHAKHGIGLHGPRRVIPHLQVFDQTLSQRTHRSFSSRKQAAPGESSRVRHQQ